MVRIVRKSYVGNNNGVEISTVFGFCNTSDSKPTANIGNGSILIDVQTEKAYMFNESAQTWREMSASVVINPASGVEF